jgi:hypothetical protein
MADVETLIEIDSQRGLSKLMPRQAAKNYFTGLQQHLKMRHMMAA